MAELYGLECIHPDCVHDSVKSYRLRSWVRMTVRPPDMPAAEWVEVQGTLVAEDLDRVFRAEELESALADMRDRGVVDPKVGTAHWVNDTMAPLPPGADARIVVLQPERRRRMAIYFRWSPEAGDTLTADKVFQIIVAPGSTAAERRSAPERRMPEEEFRHVFRRGAAGGLITRITDIRCQHCHRVLPLRAFNTLGTRNCDKGD